MTSYPMEKEENAARLIELVKRTIASLPQPHDVRTREHHEQCDECREWRRAVENSFEKIEGEEGMMSGELGMLMFMALTEQASDLATLTGSPPYSRSLSLAALERLLDGSPEGLVKELARGLEWAANTKAAMLSVSNVLEKAIRDGELEIPGHRQTHKSRKELLACDICQDWKRRRDAILGKALGSKPDWL
jgi:hypothetical protein